MPKRISQKLKMCKTFHTSKGIERGFLAGKIDILWPISHFLRPVYTCHYRFLSLCIFIFLSFHIS